MSLSSKGRRSRQESAYQSGNETAEGVEETGYEYPLVSNVVLGIMADRQIEAQINANADAIAGIEAMLPAEFPTTLAGIETELLNIGQRVSALESIDTPDREWIEQRIQETELVLNERDIDRMGFSKEQWVLAQQANFNQYNEATYAKMDWAETRYINYPELKNVEFHLPWGNATRKDTLAGFLSVTWKDGVMWPNDNILRLLMAETDELFFTKLNKTDFNNFLRQGVTPEFMDIVVGSLMDVDIGGVRQNLGTALGDRPTFEQIPSMEINTPGRSGIGMPPLLLTQWLEWIQRLESTKIERNSPFNRSYLGELPLTDWVGIIDENRERLDGLSLPELPDIGGMITCFTRGGNALSGLITSLQAETNELATKFNSIKLNMTLIKTDFDVLSQKIENFRNNLGSPSIQTFVNMVKDLMGEFKDFIVGGGPFQGVSGSFNMLSIRFGESQNALDRLRDNASSLRACGEQNLDW